MCLGGWFYHFDRRREGAGGDALGAYHGAEIPYIFNRHDDWLPLSAEDEKLSELMQAYWVNFARTGNPNDEGLPDWQSLDSGMVMGLGSHSGMIGMPEKALCEALSEGSGNF